MKQAPLEPSSDRRHASARKGRLVLLTIFLGTALPFLAAYLFHQYAEVWRGDSRTVNRGILITPPLAIQKLQLVNEEGEPLFAGEFPGKWYILQLAVNDCTEKCLERRHELRQVHVALGKEMTRVNRILLGDKAVGKMPSLDQLSKEEPQLQLAYGNLNEIRTDLEKIGVADSVELNQLILLVDPLGNIMMYYTPVNSAKDLLNDLQKLLKTSQIG